MKLSAVWPCRLHQGVLLTTAFAICVACSSHPRPAAINSAHDLIRALNSHGVECDTNEAVPPGAFAHDAWLCDTGGGGDLVAYFFDRASARKYWIRNAKATGTNLLVGKDWALQASSESLATEAQRIVGGSKG